MRIKTFTLVIVMFVASTAVLAAPAPWVAANQPDHLFRTKASNKDAGRQYLGTVNGGAANAVLNQWYTPGGATYDLNTLDWTNPTGGMTNETSWGVFKLDTFEWLHEGAWSNIIDNKIADALVPIPWGPTATMEVVGIFYGLQDNAVKFLELDNDGPGGNELIYDIKASNMKMDLWVQDKGQYASRVVEGPLDDPLTPLITGRFGAEKYAGVGYADQTGTAFLSGAERVLRVSSVGGYFADEVIISFNNTAYTGTFSAYLEVIPGTDPTDGLPHEWDGYVDRNPFPNNVGNPGGPYPNTADISILTNLKPGGIGTNNPAGNFWLLESEDPIAGATPVPGAALLGLIGLGTLGLVRRVRRTKQKT